MINRGTAATIVIIMLVLGAVAAFTLSTTKNSSESEAARTLKATADTSYTDLEGNPVTFDQYKDKVRIVNAWASWCPFCVQELPDFEELAIEFSSDEVVVIAINRKESKEQAARFLKSISSTDHIQMILDPGDAFYTSIGGFSMPETVFYDKEGNVSTHKRGFMSLDEMRTLVQKALDETNE